MPSSCDFVLNHSSPNFYSGETVSGGFILKTTRNKSVNAIYITIKGLAKVECEEKGCMLRSNRTYVNIRTDIECGRELLAGTHTYIFSIPLPADCPTSCIEQYGRVTYEIALELERSAQFRQAFKHSLTVTQAYNLNSFPELLLPLESEDLKYFCCWPWPSGPVVLTLKTPFGAYAPGQRINYALHIDNQALGNDLKSVKLSLVQIYEFRVFLQPVRRKTIKNTLFIYRHTETVRRLSKRLVTGKLDIPMIPPTSRNNCIVQVSYVISVDIDAGDCQRDWNMEMPIIIGTIPLTQSEQDPIHTPQWIPQTPDTPVADVDLRPVAAVDLPPCYDIYRPPSFEEATRIGEVFENTIEGTNFLNATASTCENTAGIPLLILPPTVTEDPNHTRSLQSVSQTPSSLGEETADLLDSISLLSFV